MMGELGLSRLCLDGGRPVAASPERVPLPPSSPPSGESAGTPPGTKAEANGRRAWGGEPETEELADAMYEQMLARETEVRSWVPSGGYWRELLVCRSNVVDWCYEACESLRLEAAVLHLATHYLDWTMLATPIAADEMQVLCMACIVAAAKFHGPEFAVPPLSAVTAHADCSEDVICAMEMRVLFALDWRLNAVTALQVAEHHLALGVVVPKDGCGSDTRAAAKLSSKLRKIAEFYLLQVLYEHRFLESRATLCGAAAIAAARETLGLEAWPSNLEQRSSYTWSAVSALAEEVLDQAHSRFPEEFFRDADGRWTAAGLDGHAPNPSAVTAAKDGGATDYSPPASPLADFDRTMVGADS